MPTQGTTGNKSTEGFVSITQGSNTEETKTGDSKSNDSHTSWDLGQVPVIFKHLEDHFPFSAVLISIIGYVVIAAFGAMHTLGEYLGYIVFLCGILFVYKSDKEKKIWLYLSLLVIALLIGLITVQNWKLVTTAYDFIDKPFKVDVDASRNESDTTQILVATSTQTTASTTH